ncbi:MAG: M23 family metallopeptidase [Trueperaceae bacterium]|nr:M23 family metallopeptidase [Trueperaceae bacterium]
MPRLPLALLVLLLGASSWAQTLPEPDAPVLRPHLEAHVCEAGDVPVARNAAEEARFAMRARYRTVLPAFLARVGEEPDAVLRMPVEGLRVAQVADTFGAPRGGGRGHDGQDLFAPRGTPVRAAAPGLVYRIDDLSLGALSVTVVAGGGHRHFYTHLDAVPDDLREGQRVDASSVIGFVGNSGNAAGTPTHLHFGVYAGTDENPCAWEPLDPLPLLVDRD